MYMYSLEWEFDALIACGVVVSSPFANKVGFFSCWEDEKIVAWLLEPL
jgi:hypothetical protein